MPSLQVNDEIIVQSSAIYRYLANEFGFYGKTTKDKVIIDQITETMTEIFRDFATIFLSQDSDDIKVVSMLLILYVF